MALSGTLWEKIAYILLGVGALDLGLDKVFSFSVIGWLLTLIGLASYSIYVYGAVGLAGVYKLYTLFK